MLKKSYSPLNAKTFFQRFKTSFLKTVRSNRFGIDFEVVGLAYLCN